MKRQRRAVKSCRIHQQRKRQKIWDDISEKWLQLFVTWCTEFNLCLKQWNMKKIISTTATTTTTLTGMIIYATFSVSLHTVSCKNTSCCHHHQHRERFEDPVSWWIQHWWWEFTYRRMHVMLNEWKTENIFKMILCFSPLSISRGHFSTLSTATDAPLLYAEVAVVCCNSLFFSSHSVLAVRRVFVRSKRKWDFILVLTFALSKVLTFRFVTSPIVCVLLGFE